MSHKFQIVNADTDSISFAKPDGSSFTEKEQDKLLNEVNSLMVDGIIWEHDGVFPFFGIIGAKNYIMLDDEGKIKIKGSALKATKKEPRLKKFTIDICHAIAEERIEEIPTMYFECAKEIMSIDKKTDISQWSFKVTATEKVLEPTTAFNQKANDALMDNNIPIVEGDKYYMFFRNISEIKEVKYINKKGIESKKKVKVQKLELVDSYDGDIDKMVLLKKLFVTIKIFNRVLDLNNYPNFTLKKNLKALQTLIGINPVPNPSAKNKPFKKRLKR